MSILCVGSVALDSVETPFGKAERVVGGSAVYFTAAATVFHPVRIVGVVGDDYPMEDLDFLSSRGVDLSGIERTLGDVFLGNIDPALQIDVLDQMAAPEVVACDTMNFWIDGARDRLLELIGRVRILMVNDEEVRQLADEPNLLKAARWVQERGPEFVIVKKGEHGAILFGPDWLFYVPGYPLEEVFDPTGAGDSFAGGFMGSLARHGSVTPDALRNAMVVGSALGSFACERFSVERLKELTQKDVWARIEEFRQITAFEAQLPAAEHV
jgi:sugar/nucleoside kinase (ribokinase family)